MAKRLKFSERLMKETRSFLVTPKNKKDKGEYLRRVEANLFGERIEGDHEPIGKRSERDIFLGRVLRYYFEIDESIRRIEMSEKYLLGRVPKYFSKIDFLRYHYEYFLHEFYVYEQRLEALLNYLSKRARAKDLINEKDKISLFKKSLIKDLKQIIDRRGQHVHERRYKSDKFDQLVSLDLYSSLDDVGEYFGGYRDKEFRKEKRRVIKEIRQIRETLIEVVEVHLYKQLGRIIFDNLLKAHKGKR